MPAPGTLLKSLHDLSPRQFENVVYDLVSAAGLRNAVWRTPGADGGRDIEGDFPTSADFIPSFDGMWSASGTKSQSTGQPYGRRSRMPKIMVRIACWW
jgi:hypothetical protein